MTLLVAESDIPFVERPAGALMVLGLRDFALDLLVYTPAEAKAEASTPGTAVYWAEREGREVYASRSDSGCCYAVHTN